MKAQRSQFPNLFMARLRLECPLMSASFRHARAVLGPILVLGLLTGSTRTVFAATSITVIPGAAGAGSLDAFLSASDGTILSGDGGSSPGTVSTGALTNV